MSNFGGNKKVISQERSLAMSFSNMKFTYWMGAWVCFTSLLALAFYPWSVAYRLCAAAWPALSVIALRRWTFAITALVFVPAFLRRFWTWAFCLSFYDLFLMITHLVLYLITGTNYFPLYTPPPMVLASQASFSGELILTAFLVSGLPQALCALGLTLSAYHRAYTIHQDQMTFLRPEGPPCRIAFLADLHYGSLSHPKAIESMFQEIAEAKPDLLLLGGDLTDHLTRREDLQQIIQWTQEVNPRYGTYFVYGNHDLDVETYASFSREEWAHAAKEAGIQILEDEAIWFPDLELILLGRLDHSMRTRQELAEEEALAWAKIDPSLAIAEQAARDQGIAQPYRLLVNHQPIALKGAEDRQVDLVLCGHTHAGQIWPVNLIIKILKIYQPVWGLERQGTLQVFTTAGVGFSNLPLRNLAQAEYHLIQIKPSQGGANVSAAR